MIHLPLFCKCWLPLERFFRPVSLRPDSLLRIADQSWWNPTNWSVNTVPIRMDTVHIGSGAPGAPDATGIVSQVGAGLSIAQDVDTKMVRALTASLIDHITGSDRLSSPPCCAMEQTQELI